MRAIVGATFIGVAIAVLAYLAWMLIAMRGIAGSTSELVRVLTQSGRNITMVTLLLGVAVAMLVAGILLLRRRNP